VIIDIRLRTTDQEERLTTKNDWPRRLTTIWLCVCVQLLTYVDMSGWKVSILLLSANALWDMFAV